MSSGFIYLDTRIVGWTVLAFLPIMSYSRLWTFDCVWIQMAVAYQEKSPATLLRYCVQFSNSVRYLDLYILNWFTRFENLLTDLWDLKISKLIYEIWKSLNCFMRFENLYTDLWDLKISKLLLPKSNFINKGLVNTKFENI